MTIKDPNEIVARLYPTSTVAAGSGAPLTIRQPDGTNAVYDGSNAVTADARPKTLTIKKPDGTSVAYNGSAAVTVDTRGATLTVNNSDGTTTTFNGSANKTITIPSTLPPTPGSVDFGSLDLSFAADLAALQTQDGYLKDIVQTSKVINVKKFWNAGGNIRGAKGDGSTDDASVLNEAFQTVQSTGGIVYFPPGVYVVRSYVEFFSNVHIIGVPGASILTYSSADADTGRTGHGPQSLLRNKTTNTQGGYSATSNIIIEGLTFDGGDFMKKSTHLGIGHAQNIVIRNCTFKNGKSNCSSAHYLELNACKDAVVEGCTFLPEWHFAMDRDHQYAVDFAAYPVDPADLDKSWGQVGGKWNEVQRVYGEHINIDMAYSGAYGHQDYYLYDGTVCDDITVRSCYFESYPSNYFLWDLGGGQHGGYYVDNNITTQAAADAAIPRQPYISYAIGGHYYRPKPYLAEGNLNVRIHDCYFVGDWNVGYVNKNPDQIRNDRPPAAQDWDNLSIPMRRYTITDSYMTGESDGWVVRNNTFRALNTGANEHPNRLPVGVEINSHQTHNMIHSNTFINYDTLLYAGTVSSQHYWDNVNVKTDGTVVVANNLS